jgi:hypothetical protein
MRLSLSALLLAATAVSVSIYLQARREKGMEEERWVLEYYGGNSWKI